MRFYYFRSSQALKDRDQIWYTVATKKMSDGTFAFAVVARSTKDQPDKREGRDKAAGRLQQAQIKLTCIPFRPYKGNEVDDNRHLCRTALRIALTSITCGDLPVSLLRAYDVPKIGIAEDEKSMRSLLHQIEDLATMI